MKNAFSPVKQVVTENSDKTLTQQQSEPDQNIKNIMKRYRKTGVLGNPFDNARREQMYGDFSQIGSFHEVQMRVQDANDQFSELPSDIRKKFRNDPGKFLDFVADEKNRAEAIELGLIVQTEEKAPVEVKIINEKEPEKKE